MTPHLLPRVNFEALRLEANAMSFCRLSTAQTLSSDSERIIKTPAFYLYIHVYIYFFSYLLFCCMSFPIKRCSKLSRANDQRSRRGHNWIYHPTNPLTCMCVLAKHLKGVQKPATVILDVNTK